MISLRPHQVFGLIEGRDRLVTLPLPFQHSLTTMLERAVLMTLVKATAPQRIFEFGTYLGETTQMFAENSSARIFTLDIGSSGAGGMLDSYEKQNRAQADRDQKMFSGSEYASRIEELIGDSTLFDFAPYRRSVDFVLIDGGHHIDVVQSDTRNAFELVRDNAPACIVWHDYTNPVYEITAYLDALSEQMPLWHVQETQYAFTLLNAPHLARQLEKRKV